MKTVVTSFTEEGYERYGKAFIDSFREHWPKDVKLVVYYEGTNLREGWRHIEEVEILSDWMEAIGNFPVMSGKIGSGYNINLDARMARKSFIQAHAIKQFGGKVFWIDADTITHSAVPSGFLDSVLPDDKFSCYLGRDWMYTESGFIGFNAEHPMCASFFTAYLQVFISGAIFTRPGWHDCYGFDAARKIIKHPEAFNDLAAHLPEGVLHPLINSVLGAHLDHLKGNRKGGSSSAEDLVIERTEPYWKGVQSAASKPRIDLGTNLQQAKYEAGSSTRLQA